MDSQEALNKLVKASCPNCDGEGCKGCSIEKICNCKAKYWIDRIQRDIDKAKKYDEKETPKKVIEFTSEITNSEEAYTFFTCTDCRMLLLPNQKYCSHCGQKLDWSDDEDE